MGVPDFAHMATKQGGNRNLALETLNLPEILTDIVKHLTRHEALKLRAVCKTLRSTITAIQGTAQYKQRLLVVASESNKLIEVDPVTEDIVSCRPVRKPVNRKVKSGTNEWWPTAITLCPYNGDFYVCQYAGRSVRRFDGASLAYVRIAAALPAPLCSPEGICFSKHSMYVVSAGAAAIARFPWDAEIRDFAAAPIDVFDGLDFAMVPWTMITGPDGNLFVATDVNYTELLSHHSTKGEIVKLVLTDQGAFEGQRMLNVDGSVTASTIIGFCGGEQDSRLRRPSGLAFDSQGYLYVTSFINMGQVLVYTGPLMGRFGQFVRVAVAWDDTPRTQGLGALLPWDVQWSPGIPGFGTGPLLFVTRHIGLKDIPLQPGYPRSRVSIYCAVSGACIKEICCSHFKQANMMALA